MAFLHSLDCKRLSVCFVVANEIAGLLLLHCHQVLLDSPISPTALLFLDGVLAHHALRLM